MWRSNPQDVPVLLARFQQWRHVLATHCLPGGFDSSLMHVEFDGWTPDKNELGRCMWAGWDLERSSWWREQITLQCSGFLKPTSIIWALIVKLYFINLKWKIVSNVAAVDSMNFNQIRFHITFWGMWKKLILAMSCLSLIIYTIVFGVVHTST